MNVTDFEAPAYPGDWPSALRAIFERQRELMVRYKEIEQLPDPPVPLHHHSGQRVLKDFAWRTVEELAESWEAYLKHSDPDVGRIHQTEELADGLHFLVELLIFAGVTVEQCLESVANYPTVNDFLSPPWGESGSPSLQEAYWRATMELGVAMNFLRNKPWKTSQVPTDEGRFRAQLRVAFAAHVDLWAWCGFGPEVMFDFYFRKSEVNRFRQRSAY